jgi:glycerol-3-phosphate dehydrogenase (NAD(P)+)
VVASPDAAFATRIAEDLASPTFRTYISTDIMGVEIGGAVKNVIAIGAGMSDGMGFGANTRVALITRGLNEMTRLGVALGARTETFMGLAGLGDLVLTCTDDQSRNRRFGMALAHGGSPEAAMKQIGQVVEGYRAASILREVARRHELDLPICEGICRILFDGADASEVVRELMRRPPRAEFE